MTATENDPGASPETKAALSAFKNAAVALSAALEKELEGNVLNFPPYLPSFDEFAYDVLAMEARE